MDQLPRFGKRELICLLMIGFCSERFLLPLGARDGLRYFIMALPEPSIYIFYSIFCRYHVKTNHTDKLHRQQSLDDRRPTAFSLSGRVQCVGCRSTNLRANVGLLIYIYGRIKSSTVQNNIH